MHTQVYVCFHKELSALEHCYIIWMLQYEYYFQYIQKNLENYIFQNTDL